MKEKRSIIKYMENISKEFLKKYCKIATQENISIREMRSLLRITKRLKKLLRRNNI
jgi:hypothetical protein